MTTLVPLHDLALHMGDNCLILGQRLSQWCGHAPILEEDIAQANIALDLIGQTQYWLELAGVLEAQATGAIAIEPEQSQSQAVAPKPASPKSADDLAFLRDASGFRNALLVELPNGDYAHTIMRQYLFDAWHYPMLEMLRDCDERQVSEIAGKAVKEVAYHLKRSTQLVIALGDGSAESHRRMQAALDELWMYSGELFAPDGDHEAVRRGGVQIPIDYGALKDLWDVHVGDSLHRAGLRPPRSTFMQQGGRRGIHTEHLGYILAQMQFLQRAYPRAQW